MCRVWRILMSEHQRTPIWNHNESDDTTLITTPPNAVVSR